ncbi:MAG: radical SAM protein [Candidatus Omnitrophica bacterium]|nr:radical SAM protein [Candidatus Omnitrophota bacterium]
MKILLINPPFERLQGIAHIYFPLGLGYLCSSLLNVKEADVWIYNAELPHFSEGLLFHARYQEMLKLHNNYIESLRKDDHYVWQEVHRVIKGFNPDVIGISAMTAKYGSALKVSQIAKSLKQNCKVIWGGPHATIDSVGVLRNNCVDFVARGEGEITLRSLISLLIKSNEPSCDDMGAIAGLSFKNGSGVIGNPDRPPVEELDALEFPEKNRVFFMDRYLPTSWSDMITLRGCPFRCGYCGAHNIWTYKVRRRSLDNILEEIEMIIAKYNLKKFYFWDDNFTLNRERTIEFCRLLRKRKVNINWGCTTRVDLLDDILLKEMKDAGCNYVSVGIETGSEKMLKNIHKGISLEKIDLAIKLLDKHHIRYEAFFMIGFPEETSEDIEQTFNLMKLLSNANICFSIFTPYPGTEQFEIAKRHKLIPENPDWSRFSHQSQDNHFMKYVEKEQFRQYVQRISLWIDENNTRNIEIKKLFWDNFLIFGLLIRRPELLFNKLKTLIIIIRHKARAMFNTAEAK